MQSNSLRKEIPVIRKSTNQPYVTILVTFDPTMTSKVVLENKLKNISNKIKTELFEKYSFVTAKEVSDKLATIINNLDYNTHKKSALIMVSADDQKVFYRNDLVEEKFFISDAFQNRKIVSLKKDEHEYLLFYLTQNHTAIYKGKGETISKILINVFDPFAPAVKQKSNHYSKYNVVKQTWYSFLRFIDKNLAIILDAFPLPVIAAGTQTVLNSFEQVTKNRAYIASFIETDIQNATEDDLEKLVRMQLENWSSLKQVHLIQLLDAAMEKGKLAVGIQEVWEMAKRKNIQHLVIENDFSYPAYSGKGLVICTEEAINNSLITDAVDDVIEKVLADGGEIDFISKGGLKDYLHIAAIRSY